MDEFFVELAGIRLAYRPSYPETARFFTAFSADVPAASNTEGACQQDAALDAPVSIPEADWSEYLRDMEDCPHTEYSMLTEYFSDALLRFDRVILHAVALRWHDRAWLICAESGAGKSTQARYLQQLRPGEFGIICGDRPILQLPSVEAKSVCPSPVARAICPPSLASPVPKPSPLAKVPSQATDEVLVHPSPWNGKENWFGAPAAPLAGIILLERGSRNKLYALTEQEAGIPFYNHVIQSAWETNNVRCVASMITRLLSAVPIWKLTSNEVPDSTKLLLESVFTQKSNPEETSNG